MTSTLTVAEANGAAARWQSWEHQYMTSSRSTETQVRLVFVILLTTAAVWLGLQILWMPVQ